MKDQMSDALLVTGLHKNYGDHAVLKGVDFSVRRGEIFALLGSNGAGKTTTLECIEGLRRYDSGTITVNGRTGIQLQSASLPEHIRAMEAVRLFAGWNRTSADETMLSSLGIGELSGKQYYQLSTGQKRRLHLALALIRDPDILFLDEPTTGVDAVSRSEFWDMLSDLKRRGISMLVSTPYMDEARRCDRIALCDRGRLLGVDTPQGIVRGFGGRLYTLSGGEMYGLLVAARREPASRSAILSARRTTSLRDRISIPKGSCADSPARVSAALSSARPNPELRMFS